MSDGITVITGACGYVGRELSASFCDAGETVVGIDTRSAELSHADYSHYACDLSTEAGIASAADAILQLSRPVHRFVHCAAIYERTAPHELTFERIQRTFAINVSSALSLISALLPRLTCAPSYVVMLGSDAAVLGPKSGVHYAASKGAVVSAAYSLARSLAPESIVVFSVVPGVLDSPQSGTSDPERRDRFVREIPLKRLGTAQDVVNVVHMLTSGAFDYCSGQKFVVNGARHLL